MALKLELGEPEGLNLTPMIDIVFNLLIFFLLAASFIEEEKRVQLDLPGVGSVQPISDAPAEVVVQIQQDGSVVWESDRVTLAEFESRLIAALKNYPDQAVAIRGDRRVAYQSVADVIAVCKRQGVRRLDCVVQER